MPEKYPKYGQDVFELGRKEHISRHLRPGSDLPVVIGSLLDGQPIYVGVVIHGASKKFLHKGFRHKKALPPHHVMRSYSGREVSPFLIERADREWVHGRGTNEHIEALYKCSVTIVGCGAIGGYLATGLAQAGVGTLILVDDDTLKPSNTSRHVLGNEYVGRTKVQALANHVRKSFPTVNLIIEYPRKFQRLNTSELSELCKCDVVVLAGLGLDAELAIDRWISSLEKPPVTVWTWTEEFALAGHALAFLNKEKIKDFLDSEGRFKDRLTQGWDATSTIISEAGCGTAFQPYDAVDMMGTVVMAQKLVIDVILRRISKSTKRSWQGDKNMVDKIGGEASQEFRQSFCQHWEEWDI